MSVDELIQLMRTCSLAKVREQLERLKKKYPESYAVLVEFYKSVANVKT